MMHTLIAQSNTAAIPLLMHWSYCNLALNHRYLCQWTGPSLVQRVACHLLTTKPLPEPMLTYCQLDYYEQLTYLPLGQNGCHFPDDIFKCIFVKEKFNILIRTSLKFVPKGPIDTKWAFLQVMVWRWMGNKPLPEPMLIQFTDAYMQH